MDNFQRRDIADIELNSGNLHRDWLNHSIGTGDNKANIFGMRLFRDKVPVNLSGASVQGYFRNSQGTNIAISSGTISSNTAYVTLPQACYNYEGPFTLAIKVVGGGVTGTMRIVDGIVDNTNSGSAVAPTGTVPTYQEVLAVYDQMVAAKDGSVRFDIEQSLTAEQKTRARTNISGASAEEVGNLKNATMQQVLIDGSLLIDNTLITKNGNAASTGDWCASDFIDVYGAGKGAAIVNCTIYGNAAVCWYDNNKSLMGYISSDNAASYNISPTYYLQEVNIPLPTGVAYIRCCAMKNYMNGKKMYINCGLYNDSTIIKNLGNGVQAHETAVANLNNFIGKTKWKNLINQDNMVERAYIRKSDGKLITNNDYNNATDYVYLEPNTKYYVRNILIDNNNAFYSERNESSFIANPDVTISYEGNPAWHGTIETHDTGYYFRGSQGRQFQNLYISNYVDAYLPYGQVTLNDEIKAGANSYNEKKVLIIGDSISSDAYGNYKKWVTNLIAEGKLPTDTVNSSQHATGFVARYSSQNPDDFITRLEAVTNKLSYDLVIVFGGINDYIQNIPLGESGQDKTVYFKPAVDYFFQYLINNFTQARICVLLPLRTYNIYPNTAGVKQQLYSEYIHEVAKYYCLPVLNLTEESGFCPFIDSFKAKWTLIPSGYTNPDGVHPNEEYEEKYLAPMIWKFISGIIN